jgi:hypothetical protein
MIRSALQNQSRRALARLRERVAFLMDMCEYLQK